MPLQVIITAAKTVSRASVEVSSPPDDHQRDDQRDLDDRHRDGEHERPERLADPVRDTSAWWTAASTAPARNTRRPRGRAPGGLLPHVTASTTSARAGTAYVQLTARRT